MDKAQLIEMADHQIIILPKGKKISSLDYIDGSGEVFVDLDDEMLAHIYAEAAEKNISTNDVMVDAIKKFLDKEAKDV